LTAHFRVEVQNDGRCTSSPPYALMNYVNALDNACKIALAHFCISRVGILHTQQQLLSNAFEHKLLLNKTIGNIIRSHRKCVVVKYLGRRANMDFRSNRLDKTKFVIFLLALVRIPLYLIRMYEDKTYSL